MQYLGMWFLLNISRTRFGYRFPNALKLLRRVGLVCTEPLPNSPVCITQTVLVFFSASSHLRFAIPASVSEVLRETTQTYPEEVSRGKKKRRIIPWMCSLVPGCSWWFSPKPSFSC